MVILGGWVCLMNEVPLYWMVERQHAQKWLVFQGTVRVLVQEWGYRWERGLHDPVFGGEKPRKLSGGFYCVLKGRGQIVAHAVGYRDTSPMRKRLPP